MSHLHFFNCFYNFFFRITILSWAGADPGFFSGGGALVSCSTSTPVNQIVLFLQNTSCIRKLQVISGGRGVRTPCTLPLDLPLLGAAKTEGGQVFLENLR